MTRYAYFVFDKCRNCSIPSFFSIARAKTIFVSILLVRYRSPSQFKMAENDHSFPHDPVLVKLLKAAKHVPALQIIIKDGFGFEKTYSELLSDILQTRRRLRAQLPASAFDERGLLRDDSVFVTAATRTGYEFAVAFFAVRALGGAYLPLGEQRNPRTRASLFPPPLPTTRS